MTFVFFCFFFFKQKTAYEITVRDWSSDVCSSDLDRARTAQCGRHGAHVAVLDERSEERRVGKELDCCVDLGGRRIIKKKKKKTKHNEYNARKPKQKQYI